MLRIPRQSYTEEFKREAVKLVEGGIKPAEVARQPDWSTTRIVAANTPAMTIRRC